MTTTEDFAELVNRAVRAVPPKDPPLTRLGLARRCGVSRQELYNLLTGARRGTADTVRRIAQGMRIPVARVRAAIDETRRKVHGAA